MNTSDNSTNLHIVNPPISMTSLNIRRLKVDPEGNIYEQFEQIDVPEFIMDDFLETIVQEEQ